MAQDTSVVVIPAPSSTYSTVEAMRPAVTVVCGPRESGKSDLVMERAEDGDFVWDYGEVQRTLFPAGDGGNANKVMGEIKTAVFRHLLGVTAFKAAWLVVQAPGKAERQTYIDRLNAKIIVIEATATYCGRLYTDDGVTELRNEAIKWWSKYERVPDQEIVIPD